jgi:adenosine deaminase
LHAHLNGSIPLPVLQSLAREHLAASPNPAVKAGIERLEKGVVLEEISDFFGLFPAIYALTSTPSVLGTAAWAVLSHFLVPSPEDGYAECTYLELRTGPRATPHMTKRAYLEAVLDEVEKYPVDVAALIVALDRPMPSADMGEVVELAIALHKEGRRIVGIDLCGDPFGGNVEDICKHVRTAKAAGLRVTLHVAEVSIYKNQHVLTVPGEIHRRKKIPAKRLPTFWTQCPTGSGTQLSSTKRPVDASLRTT